jgi:23S rRNA pseudouridine955/2504/2580 synthase
VRDKGLKKTFVEKDLTQRHKGTKDTEGEEGKKAVTLITPLATEGDYSLVAAEIFTGRTHQIRAQAAAHGHPLLGDLKYEGGGKGGFFLHAWKLEFLEYSIEAPIPQGFREKIGELKLGMRN